MISRRKIIESQRGAIVNDDDDGKCYDNELEDLQIVQRRRLKQQQQVAPNAPRSNPKTFDSSNNATNYISSGSSSQLDSGFVSDRRNNNNANNKQQLAKTIGTKASSSQETQSARLLRRAINLNTNNTKKLQSATSKKKQSMVGSIHNLHGSEMSDVDVDVDVDDDEEVVAQQEMAIRNDAIFKQQRTNKQQIIIKSLASNNHMKKKRQNYLSQSNLHHQDRSAFNESYIKENLNEELEDNVEEEEEEEVNDVSLMKQTDTSHDLNDNDDDYHNFDPYSVYNEEDNEEEDIWYSEERLFEVSSQCKK